ncbi:hypothetical protein [Acidisphaera sp. S103]|uniref:hypothetical protein n=1 Tax=Acidisphaera sp. S103 TaxID=1747223 RepID=UPI0020B11C60|nr:hypothetical protein [Acidisphaera sp. S103]
MTNSGWFLADAPPLPGEEARYAQALAVLAAAKDNPKLKQAMTEGATEADERFVKPFSNSAITANSYRTTGARSQTKLLSAPTITPARPSQSPISSSIHRTRQSISTKTSIPMVHGSSMPTATP